MTRKNYKKGFDVLLRNKALWTDRTDKEKHDIFKTLNEEAGFNYELKGYDLKETNPEQSLRDYIIEVIKSNDERGGVEIQRLKDSVIGKFGVFEVVIDEVITRLLEDGLIFEPKAQVLRWLG